MCSKIVEGLECLRPTSNTAETKSRCSSSGQVNRLDQRPSVSLAFFRPFGFPVLLVVAVSSDCGEVLLRFLRMEDRDDGLELDSPSLLDALSGPTEASDPFPPAATGCSCGSGWR